MEGVNIVAGQVYSIHTTWLSMM